MSAKKMASEIEYYKKKTKNGRQNTRHSHTLCNDSRKKLKWRTFRVSKFPFVLCLYTNALRFFVCVLVFGATVHIHTHPHFEPIQMADAKCCPRQISINFAFTE